MKTALLSLLLVPAAALAEPLEIGFSAIAHQVAQSKPTPAVVPALAAAPASWAGKRIVVVGLLENVGKNFFTDRRVVLSDAGAFIDASVPVPAHAFPKPGTPTLPELLGKRVELVGTLEERDLPKVGKVWVFVSESFRFCTQAAPAC